MSTILSKTEIPDIAAYNSLFAFCFKYRNLTPPDEWKPAPVHRQVCNLVQDAIENNKRIIICMPPQHGKSQICSIYAPAWYLWKNPDKNVALVTYSAELAEDKSIKARAVVKASFDRQLSSEAKSRKNWALTNAKDMSFRARGVGGGLTGNAVHFLILDDLIKNHEEAESATQRKKIWDYLESTITTRLSENAPVIAILTRWHMDDYATKLQKNWGWPLFNFPSICINSKTDLLDREEGDPLVPFLHSKESLMKTKNDLSTYVWNALYQGNPISSEAARIKREWFKYFNGGDIETIVGKYNIYQTVDTSGTDNEKSDYFVVITFALITKTLEGLIITDPNEFTRLQRQGVEFCSHIYVLDVLREKFVTVDHDAVLHLCREKWNPVCQYVENKTFGLNIIQSAQLRGLPVKPLEADVSKFLRSERIRFYYEKGRVWHLEDASWLEDFEEEITTFPVSEHDDQFDAISYVGIVAANKKI